MTHDAVFSPCRRYRYALWRRWGQGDQVLFVMLNPSTADERADDPTIHRCLAFADAWGNWGRLRRRSVVGREMLSSCHRVGLTREGEPRHPLYMPAGARPVPWPREDVER